MKIEYRDGNAERDTVRVDRKEGYEDWLIGSASGRKRKGKEREK